MVSHDVEYDDDDHIINRMRVPMMPISDLCFVADCREATSTITPDSSENFTRLLFSFHLLQGDQKQL